MTTEEVTDVTRNLLQLPERIVKPRTTTPQMLPVIAMHGPYAVTEEGEQLFIEEIERQLPTMHCTLFVKLSSADWVAELDGMFAEKYPKSWQWRVSEHERDVISPDKQRRASLYAAQIHYFGFKKERNNQYHTIIDPVVMYGRKLDEIWPEEGATSLMRLLKWGIAIRDFCYENNLRIRPTMGSIAVQFLTDRRFYPKPRRKVPAATNASVRKQLPGNYYVLDIHPHPSNNFTAHYIDQHRAHHYHARTLQFPHADNLYAYGRFVDLAAPVFRSTRPDFMGLYCLDLEAPEKSVVYHWLNKVTDLTGVFVYSSELQHILDMGYRVTGVRAAWGSLERDTGLNAYATFAEEQLDKHSDAPWLKPLLLSTYGTLATRPKEIEAIFKIAKRGKRRTVITGHHRLTGFHIKGSRKLEPKIANVLHRGLIEAATRSESSGLAQHLAQWGHHVLQIYADAVIVEEDADNPLPFIPEPWRLKDTLTHLQFLNQQAFMSDQMTKLPGTSGAQVKRYRAETIGRAPRRIKYDSITGKPIHTDRRI